MRTFGSFFRIIAVLTALVFFSVPLLAQQIEVQRAQQQKTGANNSYVQGKIDGENDAKGNPVWFFAGLGCGILGVGAAYIIKPTPSTDVLIGRSGEYISGYMKGYQNKARMANLGYACAGWAAWIVIFFAVIYDAEEY